MGQLATCNRQQAAQTICRSTVSGTSVCMSVRLARHRQPLGSTCNVPNRNVIETRQQTLLAAHAARERSLQRLWLIFMCAVEAERKKRGSRVEGGCREGKVAGRERAVQEKEVSQGKRAGRQSMESRGGGSKLAGIRQSKRREQTASRGGREEVQADTREGAEHSRSSGSRGSRQQQHVRCAICGT